MIKGYDLHKIEHSFSDCREIDSFKGVAIDSRKVGEDELFFAIKGERLDGHTYLKDVFNNGASAAVIERKRYEDKTNPLPQGKYFVIEDTTKALGELARLHRRRFNIPVICIGGSNGKTTTKDITAKVLSEKYEVLSSEGSYNNHIGVPLTLLKLNDNHTFCVLEAGCNHFGEIQYICEIAEPTAGLITNIGKEHLEFFKDEDGVAKAEFEMFDWFKQQSKGTVFINLDDSRINSYSEKLNNIEKFSYSYQYDANVKGEFLGFDSMLKPTIEIKYKDEVSRAVVNAFGKHSIYNGLAAAAVGYYFGLSSKEVVNSLGSFEVRSGKRMEVSNSDGIVIINDAYNSNPSSVKLGLETLKEFNTEGTKYIVLSDMLELGETSEREHRESGRIAKELGFTNVYTYGKESKYVHEELKDIIGCRHFETKDELSEELLKNMKSGDCVYFKGSRSMKMEEVAEKILQRSK